MTGLTEVKESKTIEVGHGFLLKLISALGIDPKQHIRSITIKADMNEVATVNIDRVILEWEATAISDAIRDAAENAAIESAITYVQKHPEGR